jgi:hypothetical protein
MFRADLLIIIRRCYSVYTAIGICHASQHKRMIYTNSSTYRVVLPDDEQYTCSKPVEVNY